MVQSPVACVADQRPHSKRKAAVLPRFARSVRSAWPARAPSGLTLRTVGHGPAPLSSAPFKRDVWSARFSDRSEVGASAEIGGRRGFVGARKMQEAGRSGPGTLGGSGRS